MNLSSICSFRLFQVKLVEVRCFLLWKILTKWVFHINILHITSKCILIFIFEDWLYFFRNFLQFLPTMYLHFQAILLWSTCLVLLDCHFERPCEISRRRFRNSQIHDTYTFSCMSLYALCIGHWHNRSY